jgi:SAM-dependent methyltransferase
MNLLTEGNAAKLYCSNWIEQYIESKKGEISILDLGCGNALNFVKLLQKYKNVRYTGIEPSATACEKARHNLAGLNATIVNGLAYNIYGQSIHEQFDLVVSFSVFEHVYRRLDYLRSAKTCLKPDGYFLINYDAGHFVSPGNLRERTKNLIGPLMARLGRERYFQAFVPEVDFQSMATQLNFRVIEARNFNTQLKGVYKIIPSEHQADFMEKWLDFEQWLNSLNMPYEDDKARYWRTRNFILTHAS